MIHAKYVKALFIAAGLSLLLTASVAFPQAADQNASARFVQAGMEQMKSGNYRRPETSSERRSDTMLRIQTRISASA